MPTRGPWWLLAVLGGIGCSHYNALPPKLEPVDPVQYSRLEVPSILEVISVDFEAVASNGGDDGLRTRAFLKVYGRHRRSANPYGSILSPAAPYVPAPAADASSTIDPGPGGCA